MFPRSYYAVLQVPEDYIRVNARISPLKSFNFQHELFGIRADAARLTQGKMDCPYSGDDCVPIYVSQNSFDIHDELSKEKLPAKIGVGHQCTVGRMRPRFQKDRVS